MPDDSALSSVLIDTRDGRMISPWQGHDALEIADNADTHVNVVTERAQMLTASNGYLMSLFGIYTLQQFKLVIWTVQLQSHVGPGMGTLLVH